MTPQPVDPRPAVREYLLVFVGISVAFLASFVGKGEFATPLVVCVLLALYYRQLKAWLADVREDNQRS